MNWSQSRDIRIARRMVLAAALAVIPLQVSAQLAVNWGGNYVDSTQNLQGFDTQVNYFPIDLDGDTVADDHRVGRPFSATTPFSPAANYSGTSATFYGGFMSDGYNYGADPNHVVDQMALQNQGPNDQISFQIQQGNHQHIMHLFLYWDQADFLTGNAPISFGDDGFMSVTTVNSDQAQKDELGRWLIRQNGTFYLSEATFVIGVSQNTHTISGAQLNDTRWVAYDPTQSTPGFANSEGTDLHVDFGSATFAPLTLSAVSAVGFFFDHDTPRDNYNVSIDAFAVAVPEAGTVAAGVGLLAVVAGGFVRRRIGRA